MRNNFYISILILVLCFSIQCLNCSNALNQSSFDNDIEQCPVHAVESEEIDTVRIHRDRGLDDWCEDITPPSTRRRTNSDNLFTVEDLDAVATSNRIAGVESGYEEALKNIGPYLSIGHIFKKYKNIDPWKPSKEILQINILDGELIEISKAMVNFKNINADDISNIGIMYFIVLLKVSNFKLIDISNDKIKKGVAVILGIND